MGASFSPGMVPKRKSGSGTPNKTSPRKNKLWRRKVKSYLCLTAIELKYKHPQLFCKVSTSLICHRLQKGLGLPYRRAAKKTMLTAVIKKKILNFCNKYSHWTTEERRKVMFSDESTFRLVREVPKRVRRPIPAHGINQNLRSKR